LVPRSVTCGSEEFDMRKLFAPLGTLVLLTGMAGCSGDPREYYIDLTISTVTEVKGNLEEVKTELKKTIDDRKKDGKPITVNDINRANAKAEDLKKYGKKLQDIKERLDVYKEQTTDEQREQFAELYRGRLQDAIAGLDERKVELDQVLVDVEELVRREPDELIRKELDSAMVVLQRTLKEGREPFELLNKAR